MEEHRQKNGFHHSQLESLVETEVEQLARYAMRVPRTSFFLAILVIGALLTTLSLTLHILPWWAVVSAIATLLIPLLSSVLRKRDIWTRRIALTTITVLTAGLLISVFYLVDALFHHTESALSLFRDAILLWTTNILVFAVWYWEVDQGGPLKRHAQVPEAPDLLFPQMVSSIPEWETWHPAFVDYLFLAFNTSTAFSPTDTAALSRRIKVLMMTQSSISLIVVAVIAARAINIA
ncbi:Protein of unknown function [Alicyclobacillus hesperidum]|uniref:DUF1345 domain-containing protein n=1 Tax=Alicyclobacillus hesperidum TaxID=89784 RepID=A0A1H2QSA2_9BACL|nr:DUF1345 domain-containing protein [Alicyclobacillus hesperidum]SDW10086.1 Protein of unknown function [Alicyclobacillus hesperidum]